MKVTNTGDAIAYLAEKQLDRYGPDRPFVAKVRNESGELENQILTAVVYDGAAEVPPGETVEWVLSSGRTLYGDGELDVEELDPE